MQPTFDLFDISVSISPGTLLPPLCSLQATLAKGKFSRGLSAVDNFDLNHFMSRDYTGSQCQLVSTHISVGEQTCLVLHVSFFSQMDKTVEKLEQKQERTHKHYSSRDFIITTDYGKTQTNKKPTNEPTFSSKKQTEHSLMLNSHHVFIPSCFLIFQ